MEMWADYLKERQDTQVLELDQGFALYSFPGDKICYLKDIYVRPEDRRKKFSHLMADRVSDLARERGCDTLIGSVDITAKAAAESMQAVLTYGLRPYLIEGTVVFFRKNIGRD